jgi:hypothetical protein
MFLGLLKTSWRAGQEMVDRRKKRAESRIRQCREQGQERTKSRIRQGGEQVRD